MPEFVKVPNWAANLALTAALGIASWALLSAADTQTRTTVLEEYKSQSEKQDDRLIEAIEKLNDEVVKLRVLVASQTP